MKSTKEFTNTHFHERLNFHTTSIIGQCRDFPLPTEEGALHLSEKCEKDTRLAHPLCRGTTVLNDNRNRGTRMARGQKN